MDWSLVPNSGAMEGSPRFGEVVVEEVAAAVAAAAVMERLPSYQVGGAVCCCGSVSSVEMPTAEMF